MPGLDTPPPTAQPEGSPAESRPRADAAPPERVPPRTKLRRRKYFLLGALVVLIAGFFLWRYFSSYESTDDAQVDVHLYPVSARISGYVIKVNAGDNEYVQQGNLLVEIDPRDYEVALAQARANLNNSIATEHSQHITVPITSVSTSSQLSYQQSDVLNSQASVAAAEKQLAAAQYQIEQAEANDVKAQDDLRRYKMLVDKKEVSEQIYDQALASAHASTANVAAARANAASAEAAVRQAQSRLAGSQANERYAETAPQQLYSTRQRARAASADVDQKRAVLNQAELNLGYTKIYAPVTGEVNKTVVVGLNVQPGQELLTVVPLQEVWVTANFKETQLRHMRVGQKAKIHVDSTGRDYRGHIDSIGGATGPLFSLLPPENATGNYVKIVQRIPVKIVLESGENRDLLLRPGMSVEPKVYLR